MSDDADSDQPLAAPRPPRGDYKVGRGRTPEGTRWRKGQPSPNPAGRPKKPRQNPSEIAATISRTPLPIGEQGKMISAYEAMIMRLFAEALKGDRKAQRLLLKMRLDHEKTRPPPPPRKYRWWVVDYYEDDVFKRSERRPLDDGPDSAAAPSTEKHQRRGAARESRLDIFDRIAARPVIVMENGVRMKVTTEEALWKSLFADAIKGDAKAAALITRFGGPEMTPTEAILAEIPQTITMYLGDKKIINPGPRVSMRMRREE